jgi:hypothetical protein
VVDKKKIYMAQEVTLIIETQQGIFFCLEFVGRSIKS